LAAFPKKIILRPIQPDDRVSQFSLGKPEYAPLKTFLTRHAKSYHQEDIAKTFVLVEHGIEKPPVLGYITLICSEIECASNAAIEANKYNRSPAVKIARLAVHQDSQNNYYGRTLIQWAIANVIENILPNTGCRFLVVDSKKSSVQYYEKRGFTLLDTDSNRKNDHPVLFIDLHKLQLV